MTEEWIEIEAAAICHFKWCTLFESGNDASESEKYCRKKTKTVSA